MGYTDIEKVQVKKEFLRMLVNMELNPAKMELINGFFETYLKLNESEETELMEEIKQLDKNEAEQILKLPNSWREKGIQQGRQEGIRQGIQEGIQEGRQEGIQEGEREARRKIALNLLKEGLSIELIARATNLGYAEIEELKGRL